MASDNILDDYFQMLNEYILMYDSYKKRGVDTTLDENDKENINNEDWRLKHYFDVGADALRIIVAALQDNMMPPPKTILDFPSGSGRVTRHLKSYFTDANIVACDLYDYHVSFCSNVLGVRGYLSDVSFSNIMFDQKFDLIFCGSLLTHLPEESFKQALQLIIDSLSENGIAIITLHGRHSVFIQDNKFKYIDDDLFDIARRDFVKNGFGYVDYDHNFLETTFDKHQHYGVSLSLPSTTLSLLENNENIRILGYSEKAWDEHQDVVVFGRPGVDAEL